MRPLVEARLGITSGTCKIKGADGSLIDEGKWLSPAVFRSLTQG